MGLAAQKELEHIGESAGCADHDHDLIHELGKRLDAMWRYDQYIANAKNKKSIANFWQTVKAQDEENIDALKSLIADEVKNGCF